MQNEEPLSVVSVLIRHNYMPDSVVIIAVYLLFLVTSFLLPSILTFFYSFCLPHSASHFLARRINVTEVSACSVATIVYLIKKCERYVWENDNFC
jgi:hypothetical protein